MSCVIDKFWSKNYIKNFNITTLRYIADTQKIIHAFISS